MFEKKTEECSSCSVIMTYKCCLGSLMAENGHQKSLENSEKSEKKSLNRPGILKKKMSGNPVAQADIADNKLVIFQKKWI